APDGPWPVNLGGVGLEITDSLNQTRFAPIYFVTTNAISYLIPYGTALAPELTVFDRMDGRFPAMSECPIRMAADDPFRPGCERDPERRKILRS
ncbi:MAG: hypothetical protein JWO19_5290, partial [Bryobacterales bacterium]|nr:hypothetical protein [Bryobacterales bacterium]